MPIDAKFDHAARRVTAVCKDVVSMEDVTSFLDRVVVEGALPYGKIVDFNDARSAITPHDMQMIGASIQAYLRHMTEPLGPIALIARSDKDFQQAQMMATLAAGRRPIQVFSGSLEAVAWLREQTSAKPPETPQTQ